MELDKNSINLGKSFSKFLDDCIPKEKPESLNDDSRFIAIIVASLNTAHSVEPNTTDIAFYIMVERNLKPYKIEMSVEEYMYISDLMKKLVKPLIDNPLSLENNTQSHIQ